MSNGAVGISKLGEVRRFVGQALRTIDDLGDNAPPELEDGLGHIRDLLYAAVQRIDGATVPDPPWPGLAARA